MVGGQALHGQHPCRVVPSHPSEGGSGMRTGAVTVRAMLLVPLERQALA
jgi:hypothetical protein